MGSLVEIWIQFKPSGPLDQHQERRLALTIIRTVSQNKNCFWLESGKQSASSQITLLSTDLSYLRQFSPVCLYDNWTDESELYSINKHLVNNAQMPLSNIKWFIRARQTIKPDTFTIYLTFIFDTFPEAQAKLLAN